MSLWTFRSRTYCQGTENNRAHLGGWHYISFAAYLPNLTSSTPTLLFFRILPFLFPSLHIYTLRANFSFLPPKSFWNFHSYFSETIFAALHGQHFMKPVPRRLLVIFPLEAECPQCCLMSNLWPAASSTATKSQSPIPSSSRTGPMQLERHWNTTKRELARTSRRSFGSSPSTRTSSRQRGRRLSWNQG